MNKRVTQILSEHLISAAHFVRSVFLICGLFLLASCGSNPSATGGDPEGALSDYIQLGQSYLREGRRDQARFNLLKALDIDSRSPEANNVMALLYETEGEVELAKQLYRRALSSDRTYTPARVNYARVLYAQEDYRSARDEYETAASDVNYRLRPDAFLGVGLSELRLGNVEEAKTAFGRALQLNPNIGPALLEVASIAYEQREYPLAMEYLEAYEGRTVDTPRSLMLGIQLSRVFDEPNKEQSYALALRSMFPDSMEARQLQLEQ